MDRTANLALNIDEYTAGAIEVKSTPPVLFVELTQNCNLHCRMCRAAAGYQPGLNMSDSLFQQLREELFPYASLVDLRGWGESAILHNLPERIRDTATTGARIRLVTNALAIDRSVWKLLMEVGARVVVSVDASTPETMHLLGRGSYQKLMQSLAWGSEARDVCTGGGTINFNTVVTSPNLGELVGIVKLARDFGVRRVTLFPVVVRRTNPLHLDNRKTEIAPLVREAEAVARELAIELRIGASLHEDLVVTDGLPNRCSHPWEYCYIDYSGRVGYCDHLIGDVRLVVGDLRETKFADVWNGVRMMELRRMHVEARRGMPGQLETAYPHCAWCYRRRYVDFEEETNEGAKGRVISTSGTAELFPDDVSQVPATDFLRGRRLAESSPQQVVVRRQN